MARFDNSIALAKRLIEKNGRTVKLLRLNRTPADATKPWLGTSTQPHVSEGGASMTASMAFVPLGGSGLGKMIGEIPSTLRSKIDQVGFVATASLPTGFDAEDLESCDQVDDGGEIYKIVLKRHLKPGRQSIMFVLGLTR